MGQFWVAVLGAAHRQYFVKTVFGTVLVQHMGDSTGPVLGAMLVQYWGRHCGSTGKVLGGSTAGDSIKESSLFGDSFSQCILPCLPESAIV